MKRMGAIFMAAVMMMVLCSCGNHVAGQEPQRLFIRKLPSAQKKAFTTAIILMKLRITIFHRETLPQSLVSTGRPLFRSKAFPRIRGGCTICTAMWANGMTFPKFSGKTIIPFCSHGGGRFGQSLTAIAKLVPNARMGEALSVHYSGGSDLPDEITEWLKTNGIIK